MHSRIQSAFWAVTFALLLLSPRLFAAVELVPPASKTPAFALAANGKAAPLVLPPNAPEVVKIAARDLASDIAAVTGTTPQILTTNPTNGPRVQLILAPDLKSRWEAFRLSATPGVLTIAGSDRRGLAYGIYEISRRIGVSPWRFWADVPAPHHAEVRMSLGQESIEQPAVKYRGVFINDEDWGLQPWAAKTFEPEVGNIGPKTYAKVFELLLRLRANCLWTAMHPTTTPFFQVPGNAATADRYSIIVGSSHAEPMLRNNGREWKGEKKDFNYLTNRDKVLDYWEERIKERTSGESLFTIGMRGVEDSPIIGPKTQKERIETLEKVFADQRELLARTLGQGDPTRVPQIFVPYKEVLDDYNAGLKVPDDVAIVWPDDNYGYIRRYATPEERLRSGGIGVYYHLSYSGMPQSWLWIDTLPPALIWSEMTRAYEQGARTLWMVNVGDIKNTERSTEFFLDLAWNADHTTINAPLQWMQKAAARDFGLAYANEIVNLLTRLQSLNFDRKTEHLQWHLSMTPYQPTELNEAEIDARLKECDDLERDSEALFQTLPAQVRDAYFELVGYPVAITAAANERYFRAELARADVARGRSPEADLAAAQAGQKRVEELTAHYNTEIAGGKWRNIVTENGVSPDQWKRFQRDISTPRPSPVLDNVAPAAPSTPAPLEWPTGARVGDFVERDGVVSIDAGHFTEKSDLPSGAGWRAIAGLGRTGSAVTVLPSTAVISSASAPSLTYRFHLSTGGTTTIRVRLLPTFPIVADRGLRLSVGIDDNPLLPLAVTDGFDTKRSDQQLNAWQTRVMANATEAKLELPTPLAPGWHTLRLVAVDTGVVVDKIVLDLGGLKPSYDGPAETRLTETRLIAEGAR